MSVVTESMLQEQVIDLAHLRGWMVAHFRPARTESGWRTPVSADGKGWPDLSMVRGDRLVVAELKAERGRLTLEQERWLSALTAAGVDAYVWRPSDWAEIEEVLR